MEWLGLDHDGDITYQSRRFDLYNQAIDQLLATGHAYWCSCTPEEVEAMQHGISSSQKFVLVVLADRANEGHECWPSVDRLSLDTELDPRTVQRALVALEEGGLIKTQSRPGRSNVFKLIGVVGREDETPRQKASQKSNTPGTVSPPAESHPRHEKMADKLTLPAISTYAESL